MAMLDHARRIPTVPVARRMNLQDLQIARTQVAQAPSWSALFIRAYSQTCAQYHELRRSMLTWPYPRLYEHDTSVCAFAVEREWQGRPEVFYRLMRAPEKCDLDEVQQKITDVQTGDVEKIGAFRNVLRFGKLPYFLQRLFLRIKLDMSGPRRVKYMGTFGFSNYGMLGAESIHPLGPQTTVMTLGPMSPRGEITVKLVYDHRVLDGSYIARALNHLEDVLHTSIATELNSRIRRSA